MAALTRNQGHTKTLFLGDLDLQKHLIDLQMHENPKVYAKAISFIQKYCSLYVMDLEEEIDLFVGNQKPKEKSREEPEVDAKDEPPLVDNSLF